MYLFLQPRDPEQDMSQDQDQSDSVDQTLKVDDDDLFASAVQVKRRYSQITGVAHLSIGSDWVETAKLPMC